MIACISPAKTMTDPAGPGASRDSAPHGTAPFMDRSRELVTALRSMDADDIRRLFRVSERVAERVLHDLAVWSGACPPAGRDGGADGAVDVGPAGPPGGGRDPSSGSSAAAARAAASRCAAALHLFDGEQFRALEAETLAPEAREWAQDHLIILSGLYGALRPFDAVERYRLDYETPLAGPWGRTVFDAWRTTVPAWLAARVGESAGAPVIVNLASGEYARILPRDRVRVVDVQFLDGSGGRLRTVGVYAKRARGRFARWLCEERPDDLDALRAFDADGYRLDADRGGPDTFVFARSPG